MFLFFNFFFFSKLFRFFFFFFFSQTQALTLFGRKYEGLRSTFELGERVVVVIIMDTNQDWRSYMQLNNRAALPARHRDLIMILFFFFLFPLSSNNTIIRELIRGLLERKGWEEGWISVDVQRTWKVEEKNLLFFFLRLATTFLFFPPTTVYLNIYRGKEKRG